MKAMNRRYEPVVSLSGALATETPFEELVDRFISEADVALSSRGTYRSALRQFFVWLSKQKNRAASRETILRYKEALDVKGLRPFTRASYLVVVRLFFAWAESHNIHPNIAKGIKSARRSLKAHHKDALTATHAIRLLKTIDKNSLCGLRDYALINLLIHTGLRLIEAVRANIGDISYDTAQVILWVRGKGRDGKDECVVLVPEVLNPLEAYIKARKRTRMESPLFAAHGNRNVQGRLTTFHVSRLIKKHLKESGIDSRRVTAHSLRHTFGVLSIKSGASLYEVQLAMRHTSPATTEIYLGDIERQKRLEAAPERSIAKLLKEVTDD